MRIYDTQLKSIRNKAVGYLKKIKILLLLIHYKHLINKEHVFVLILQLLFNNSSTIEAIWFLNVHFTNNTDLANFHHNRME
jgi:hypothetical protein